MKHIAFVALNDRVFDETSNSTSFSRVIYPSVATSRLKIDISSFVLLIPFLRDYENLNE